MTTRLPTFTVFGVEVNGKEVDYKNGEYGPDIVSDYACDFIERKAKGDEPFLVYYPMMLPHWPFEPTPDSPEWDPKARVNEKSEKGSGTTTTEFFDNMVHYVDKIIGKLVAKLEAEGVRDNTLILFTGDNGTYTGITSRFKGRDWKGGTGHAAGESARDHRYKLSLEFSDDPEQRKTYSHELA